MLSDKKLEAIQDLAASYSAQHYEKVMLELKAEEVYQLKRIADYFRGRED